ncbi:very short patch repair endonuclease [Marinobacter sp. SS21]|uniref:very short patch repair endonuclease n=1 Tax=Marinobacter sp. SS21 TaxID=2979460 RepID=UPI00232E4D38|nr:very short patch repair endonuclease [Marinobacter sp. SS21]MDC0664373.1 very short patch repair endonuclease [Marinobacter sp. SS21]
MKNDLRRKIMQANKPANTRPEIRVRKALHALGYRFRIHRKDLPGKPDIVLPKHNLVLFVHGCFWHQHPGCYLASKPKTRQEFWKAKFEANRLRDKGNQLALKEMGWRVEVIWECQTMDNGKLSERLQALINPQ